MLALAYYSLELPLLMISSKNQIENGGFFARLSVTATIKFSKAVMSTLNRQPIIIPGWKNRMSLRFLKILPQSILRL